MACPIKTEDIDDVLEIEKLCFSTLVFPVFKAEIEGNYCARYVVAEQGGRVGLRRYVDHPRCSYNQCSCSS